MAKPNKNNFEDIKMLIATLSITMTFVFWHLFSSTASAQEQVAVANIPQASMGVEPVTTTSQAATSPGFTGKILLGGQAPQPQVVVQRAKPSGNNNGNAGNNNGGGGNGGGGNVVTQTKSS